MGGVYGVEKKLLVSTSKTQAVGTKSSRVPNLSLAAAAIRYCPKGKGSFEI